MKSIIDHLNEAYEVNKASTTRRGYQPAEDFSKNKIVKKINLINDDTVEISIDNENPTLGDGGYHLYISPEEWMYGGEEDGEDNPKTYIFKTTKKIQGQELLVSVGGDEYTDYIPFCDFESDGPITLDLSGLGFEGCTFTGPITVKDGDNRGKNKFNKGAKEF